MQADSIMSQREMETARKRRKEQTVYHRGKERRGKCCISYQEKASCTEREKSSTLLVLSIMVTF